MPQKKNPDVAELARGKTGRVYGSLFSLLTVLKGLPLAYNKDLQEDKEPLFDAVETLEKTLTIFTPMLNQMKINVVDMQVATKTGYLNATALAEYLVKKNIPFRVAHDIVGEMVSYCMKKNSRLEELTLEEMQSFSSCFSEKIVELLKIENVAMNQDNGNSAQISSIDQELQVRKQQIMTTEAWLIEKKQLLFAVDKYFGL